MQHAAYVTNSMPEGGQLSPMQRMGAEQVDILGTCHPPLCRVAYRLPDAHIPDKFSDKTGDALWVGRSDEVPNGHVMMPKKLVESCGDLNVTLADTGRPGGTVTSSEKRRRRVLTSACAERGLTDLWTQLHPGSTAWTRQQRLDAETGCSQIDHAIVSQALIGAGALRMGVLTGEELNASDHRMLVLELQPTAAFTQQTAEERRGMPKALSLKDNKSVAEYAATLPLRIRDAVMEAPERCWKVIRAARIKCGKTTEHLRTALAGPLFTEETWAAAIAGKKAGTTPGMSQISTTMLKALHTPIKPEEPDGTPTLPLLWISDAIRRYVNLTFKVRHFPQSWKASVLAPIPKVPLSRKVMEQRPLCMMEVLRNLGVGHLFKKISAGWRTCGTLDSAQHAFQKDKGVEGALKVDSAVSEDAFIYRKPYYECSLDISKAFDKVERTIGKEMRWLCICRCWGALTWWVS